MFRYYVIGLSSTPWVLDGAGSLDAARAIIHWQYPPPGAWVIAKRTGPDTFVTRGGVNLTVGRGPYTVEAFEKFKKEWCGR
ncbi:MAG: hypothetical protein ACREEW_14445 [Caulobacteraceae bacterium]